MVKRFYAPKELQVVLGISRPHLYNLLNCGIIPSIRFGRRFLIPATWVDAQG